MHPSGQPTSHVPGDTAPPPRLPPLICIVDDDPDLLGALRFSLETEGYAVRTFASAEALLAAGPADRRPCCLVVDYVLPSMNGFDLIRSLRAVGVAEPAILVTTHPSVRLRQMAQGLGVRILEKPLLGRMLAQAIFEELSAQRC
jgi:two-component system, LuxR family, response regulator FixJ